MLEDGNWTGPILDQHMHLDRSNRYLDAVTEFTRAGGTGIMLVHKPSFSGSLPNDVDGFRTAYDETISMAKEVRETHQIDVGVVLGPHPVSWEKQIDSLGIKRSSELHLEAVELALEYFEEGEAHCLGEVGRPHYHVDTDVWEAANEMLGEVLSMASSAGASVQLHVEDNGEQTCRELREICLSSGLSLERAIRHYAPADIRSEFTHGLSATVSMGRGSVEKLTSTARNSRGPWGMETDFLDDPRRPGAVLGPKTIPKRTRELCSSLLSVGWDEEDVESLMTDVHVNWPHSLYGI